MWLHFSIILRSIYFLGMEMKGDSDVIISNITVNEYKHT